MDTARIRTSTSAQLSEYYSTNFKDIDVHVATQHLLDAVERGSIQPFAFRPWLSVSKSPTVINIALRQDISISIRKAALDELRKLLISSRWKETWEGLGGTQGLLNVFSDLSVQEVKQACRVLGRCGKGINLNDKRQAFTELYEALNPQMFPDATYKTNDRRPLAKHYRHLIPSCSEDIAQTYLLDRGNHHASPLRPGSIERYHPSLAQHQQLEVLAEDQGTSVVNVRLEGLITKWPTIAGSEHRFSASMEYSMKVLREVIKHGGAALSEDFVLDTLITCLLRRAIRKRVAWPRLQEIIALILQYLEVCPGAPKKLDPAGRIVYPIALCWARKPDLFEGELRYLLRLLDLNARGAVNFETWDSLLSKLPPKRRHDFLKICFKECAGIDIDKDDHLCKIKGPLTSSVLKELPHEAALDLFSRLRNARGSEGLLQPSWGTSSILECSEPDVIHTYLFNCTNKQEQALEIANKNIASSKNKAFMASEPEGRLAHAKDVYLYAVACGSLDVFEEVVQWSRRFVRDRNVLSELLQFIPQDVSNLLSGIPRYLHATSQCDEVKDRVTKSNSLIQGLFEMILIAMREPSFRVGDWNIVRGLAKDIVKARMRQSLRLKQILDLSDEQVFSVLWANTLRTIVALEELMHQDLYKKLQANHVGGILHMYWNMEHVIPQDISAYRFIDELAKARNDLWTNLRQSAFPRISTLPLPYPRGLPIQHLVQPWKLEVPDLVQILPYIGSRVMSILFMTSEEALQIIPQDKQLREVIGVFGDSYACALELFLPDSLEKDEKTKRVQKAWDHAITTLSEGRMDRTEAKRFWSSIFQRWTSFVPQDEAPPIWPTIPENASDTPRTWSPLDSAPARIKDRKLKKMTCIDLSRETASSSYNFPTLESKFQEVLPMIYGDARWSHEVWSHSREDKNKEGMTLSAMLYLRTAWAPGDQQMLSKPFPSSDDPRYPVLCLDKSFLARKEVTVGAARVALVGNLSMVPLSLYARLVSSSWDPSATWLKNIATPVTPDDLFHAMDLVISLCNSDRPSLASELAIRIVLKRRDDSSWHRQLLNAGFFRRLPASCAETCLKEFASEIISSLEQHKVGDTSEPQEVKRPAKITTIKMLAELLQCNDFVSNDIAIAIMSQLLAKSKHPDVRIEIIKFTLDSLGLSDALVAEQSLKTLETLVPVLANLSDRKPLTKEDWQQAEAAKILPELAEENLQGQTPLAFVMDHYRCSLNNASEMQAYIDRVLLPTIQKRKEEMHRWITLFLRKHDMNSAFVVPSNPLGHRVMVSLFAADADRLAYLPAKLLEDHVEYMLINIAPSSELRAFNDKLRKDPHIQSEVDARLWLQLYARESVRVSELFVDLDLLSLLRVETKLPKHEGLTPACVQTCILKIFTALLKTGNPEYRTLLEHFLAPLLRGDHLAQTWWPSRGKPLLDAMIAQVEAIRSTAWVRDSLRRPAVLPDTFPWRLRSIEFPCPFSDDTMEISIHKCGLFAGQLSTIIREMSTTVYHHKLEQIKEYVALRPKSKAEGKTIRNGLGWYQRSHESLDNSEHIMMRHHLLIAVSLGEIGGNTATATELLKLDVARHILDLGRWDLKAEKDVKVKVFAMIEMWKRCDVEDVRRTGYELDERLKEMRNA